MKKKDDFIHSYQDVKDLLNRALATEKGIWVAVPDKRAATNLVQRFNMFRANDRRSSLLIYPEEHPQRGTSRYDALVFKKGEGRVEIVKSSGDWFETGEL